MKKIEPKSGNARQADGRLPVTAKRRGASTEWMRKIASKGWKVMVAKHGREILRHGGAKVVKYRRCRRCGSHLAAHNRTDFCRKCQRRFGLRVLKQRHPE